MLKSQQQEFARPTVMQQVKMAGHVIKSHVETQFEKLQNETQHFRENPLGLKTMKTSPVFDHYEYWYPFIRIGWVSLGLRVAAGVGLLLYLALLCIHGATTSFARYGTYVWLSFTVICAYAMTVVNFHADSIRLARHRWFYVLILLGVVIFTWIPSLVLSSVYASKVSADLSNNCQNIRNTPSLWSSIIGQISPHAWEKSPAMCLPENYGLLVLNLLISLAIIGVNIIMFFLVLGKIVLLWMMWYAVDFEDSDNARFIKRMSEIKGEKAKDEEGEMMITPNEEIQQPVNV